jgi:hypothetical protein
METDNVHFIALRGGLLSRGLYVGRISTYKASPGGMEGRVGMSGRRSGL